MWHPGPMTKYANFASVYVQRSLGATLDLTLRPLCLAVLFREPALEPSRVTISWRNQFVLRFWK